MEFIGMRTARLKKDASIESLRGLAIILMVAGHVIGSSASRGMKVPDDSLWRLYYLCLEDVRMPLFTVISGYIYAIRPVAQPSGFVSLVRAKVRRLLVPLVTVGTLFFVIQLLVPATNSKPRIEDFWRTFIFPFEHLWFLQAIFLIFLVVGLLDSQELLANKRSVLVTLGIASIVFVWARVPSSWDVFSINGALRLLPFFLIGYAIYRYKLFDLRGRFIPLAIAFLATASALKVALIFEAWTPTETIVRAVSLAVGVGSVALIFSGRSVVRNEALAWLGSFAFGIYLLHVFGAASLRILLNRVGIESDSIVFVFGLAAGLLAPVAFQLLFGRLWLVRILILGEKAARRPSLTGAA